MALKIYDESSNKFALKVTTEIFLKRVKVILKLLFIFSVICLLLFCYKTHDILGENKIMSALKLRATNYDKCDFDERVIHRVTFPFRGISIEVFCSFLDRVRVFNVALDQLRLDLLRWTHSKEWTNISTSKNIKVIGGADDNLFQQLENLSQIETVFLPWIHNKFRPWTSLEDTSNILVNKYFEWTADKELCQYIDRPRETKVPLNHNGTCISDIEKTEKPQSVSLREIGSKAFYWPKNGTTNLPNFYYEQPPLGFYLHIIKDCIVTPDSEVWSGNMYLVQHTCSYRKNKRPPQNIDKIPLYDEVMAVSQYWGEGPFHGMVEVIPRLSLYIDFLRNNPQIKILASKMRGRTAELFAILGLSKDRIISGTCRSKLLYLPRPTKCGTANLQEIQVISLLYRDYIKEKLKTDPRDKIIFIRRSRNRKFIEHTAIELMVKETAKAHNLSFELFPDNPVPSLNKTMNMFHSAVMIIAPHGAGLSNVVFSQPGTYVIEGVCNPPHVNLCYRRLSNVLGHHWHGLHSQSGCLRVLNVSVSRMKAAVERHLEFLKK